MAVFSDGFLFGWNANYAEKVGFIGSAKDFETKLHGVCAAAGLGMEGSKAVVALAFRWVDDWRVHRRNGVSPYREVR
jgi:hypothetical protein